MLELLKQPVPYLLNDFDYFARNIDPRWPIFCDTETCSLYSNIRLVQVMQEHWDKCIIFDIKDVSLQSVYNLLKPYTMVFHNYAYDSACFQEDLNINDDPFEKWNDTLILSRLAFPEWQTFSLDECFNRVYGIDLYDREEFEGGKRKMQLSFLTNKKRDGMNAQLTSAQLTYAAIDVFYFPKFYAFVFGNKYDKGIRRSYALDKEFLHACLKWHRNRTPLVKSNIDSLISHYQSNLDELIKDLPQGLNINSSVQVKQLTGLATSARDALAVANAEGNKIAGKVLTAKQNERRLSLLKKNFLPFDSIRGFYSSNSSSGRAACGGSDLDDGSTNLMQIPREFKIIIGFEKDDDKYVLVHADYAQLELRTAAAMTDCKSLMTAFEQNLDLHAYSASKMLGLSYEQALNSGKERTAAKICNFAMLYCCSASRLYESIKMSSKSPVSLQEATKTRQAWLKTYPEIKNWHDACSQAFFNENNRVYVTQTGRPYYARKVSEVAGIACQSISAEAAKYALIRLTNDLEKMRIDYKRNERPKIIQFIHDCIIVKVQNDPELVKRVGELLAKAMIVGWFKMLKFLPFKYLSMPVDVYATKTFGDKETEENLVYSFKGTYKQYRKICDDYRPEFGSYIPKKAYMKIQGKINVAKNKATMCVKPAQIRQNKPITMLNDEVKIETQNTLISVPAEFQGKHMIVDFDTWVYIVAYHMEQEEVFSPVLALEKFNQNDELFKKSFKPASITYIISQGRKSWKYKQFTDYKANRKHELPKYLTDLKNFYSKFCESHSDFEADDLCWFKWKEFTADGKDCLIAAIDKDVLKFIPSKWYNYSKILFGETTKEDAELFIYRQMIEGDQADGVKGVKGLGAKAAERIVQKGMSEYEKWSVVLKAYDNNFNAALEAARKLRIDQIIRDENGELKVDLWQPPIEVKKHTIKVSLKQLRK